MLKVIKYPNPILKKVAEPVEGFDEALKKIVDAMYETMYASYGIGLAAPQVADSRRFFVIDIHYRPEENELINKDPMVFINPEIIKKEEDIIWEEGCLSLPGLLIPVKRSKKIILKAQDLEGSFIEIQAEDLKAVCIQHELDHLNGVLLTDKLTKEELTLFKKKMERGEILRIESEDEHHPALMG